MGEKVCAPVHRRHKNLPGAGGAPVGRFSLVTVGVGGGGVWREGGGGLEGGGGVRATRKPHGAAQEMVPLVTVGVGGGGSGGRGGVRATRKPHGAAQEMVPCVVLHKHRLGAQAAALVTHTTSPKRVSETGEAGDGVR